MELPKLKAGLRLAYPHALPGSSDALLLAQLGVQCQQERRVLTIITASAQDAQRLLLEIPTFAPDLRCSLLPDWETLPYDAFSPHQDLISERLATLWRLYKSGAQGAGAAPATASITADDGVDVVLIPATTALYRLAPPAFLAQYTFDFKQGQRLNDAALKSQLTMAGYSHVQQVLAPGEYAVRGGLIDLFPMGSSVPYRVDLFDDEIDSIRTFDPDTQRSLSQVDRMRLLPGREFPMDEAARSTFRSRWRELLEGDPSKSRLYKDMGAGLAGSGIEYYLPLFFEQTATVFDYIGPAATLVLHGDVQAPCQRFWQDTQTRYQMLGGDAQHPILPPASLFLSTEQFFTATKTHPQLAIKPQTGDAAIDVDKHPELASLPPMMVTRGADDPLSAFKRAQASHQRRVLVVAESKGRESSLLDFFHASDLQPTVVKSLTQFIATAHVEMGITVAPLAQGFSWLAQNIDVVTETELFATANTVQRRKAKAQESDVEALIKDLSELQIGDPVVHSAYGIGRYLGLVNMDVGHESGQMQEFLHLEYFDNAKLYVPVSQLHLIGRYTGVSADEAPLHKLGSGVWEKAKRKAAEQIRDTAAELLNLYARRQLREGHAFRLNPQDYDTFADDFGFEETPDQSAAIRAVMSDMISPRPMDRLVCGDVGFGKTEVALRAAFIAVMGGKQVAFLAPTTLLAEQHYQTLVDRFAKWPVRIAEMSRFRTSKEINTAIKGLGSGSVDIVVGTHKLLSKDVSFANLGLLIIDEEHRFGVRHKEAMKAMRAEVDVLTLTATPIPRTLGLALEGLRDLSVIATAPQRRLAIKTFVRSESGGIIREAILRELNRGGQVYFLHNEVDTIENRLAKLQELVPEARIAIAHGQMPERDLERVMKDFIAQRFNLLLCSTIIETGIDVPSANTIIMARADKFGLAQLHQLRGRVGRSHHQAYAYLLVPDVQSLTKQAQARLDAIQQMEELGSGFYLAMHDLEIRGSGEVLGEKQSGSMMEIGFQLYNDMLGQAVAALKKGLEPDLMAPLQAVTEINLHAPTLLPSDYCGDVQQRLSLYKRLASAKTPAQIDTLQEEIVDRFGKLPPPAQTLIDVHRLRVLCVDYGIVKIDAAPTVIQISFKQGAPVDPASIIQMIQTNRQIKLAGNDKLRMTAPEGKLWDDVLGRVQTVRRVVQGLKTMPAPEATALATH